MIVRKGRVPRMFLVETAGNAAAGGAEWEYELLTGDIEAAVVSLAQSSMIARAPISRLRVGRLSSGGGVTFQEIVRMGAGGRFLAAVSSERHVINVAPPLPPGPATSPSAVLSNQYPPPLPRSDEFDVEETRTVRRMVARAAAGALTFTGSVAAALIAITLFLSDTPQVAYSPLDIDPEPDHEARLSKLDQPVIAPAPPPLPVSLPTAVPEQSIEAKPWMPLFYGLRPGIPLEDVRARFSGCFQAGDGSFYCEGTPPIDMPNMALLVARFEARSPHRLADVLMQSVPFDGAGSRDRAVAAFGSMSDDIDRYLSGHRRAERNEIPNGHGFWDSLRPGIGNGHVEVHWAPEDSQDSPYARLRLVAQGHNGGYFVLHVSAPGSFVPLEEGAES